jgi:hypothetical protein
MQQYSIDASFHQSIPADICISDESFPLSTLIDRLSSNRFFKPRMEEENLTPEFAE